MKKQLVIVSALACLFANKNVSAQEKVEKLDEVVVTATKFELKKEHSGKVIYKITQKELENNAGKTVVEVLNNLPGIEIRGVQSNASEPRSTYVRGGRNREVVVLIDGVPVSDASGISQEYDLRLLSLNQIESIEILKGASSTLYGTGASTGVINITLKKASNKEITGTYEVSLGTNNDANANDRSFLDDANQNASVNGTLGKVNYLAYFSLTGKKGMSSAKSNASQVFEDDNYFSENGLFRLGYNVTDKIKIDAFLNYDAFDYDFDAGAYNDNGINKGSYKQYRYGVKPSFKYNRGEVFAIASLNKIERNTFSFNSFSGGTNNFNYQGTSLNIDIANKYQLNNEFQFIVGFNYQKHENETVTDFGNISKDLANFETKDPYASVVYTSDFGLNINLGGRLNMHSLYGNHFVYDANVSHNIINEKAKNLKVLASYSSAFIAPSLYQLYSFAGNLNLQPESSKTFEFGFDGSYNWINASAVYFQRDIKDAIIFTDLQVAPWNLYDNATTDSKVKGIEVDVTLKPIEKANLRIGYTYTDKDIDTDYIPRNKLVATVETNPFKNTFMSLTYKNVGERTYFDKWGSFGTAGTDVILPTYNLLDFNTNYKVLNEKVTFFGGISNILNEDYEETLGYSTRGRNYKLGIRLIF